MSALYNFYKVRLHMFGKSLIVCSFLLLTACAQQLLTIGVPNTPPPVPKLNFKPRVVLVLGSGGARGYAHLGVLQALEEAHIPVDVIVGSSAGSLVAALFADNSSFKKTYNILMPAGFWDYADMGNFGRSGGFIQGYQLINFLLRHMHARTFDQLKKKLIISATDVVSGQSYTIESGPIAPAVLASAAIPGAIKPVNMYGRELVDGGVLNPVPVDLAMKLHPKLIIAVTVGMHYQPQHPTSTLSILSSTFSMMTQRITQDSLRGADIVISPEVGDTNAFDIRKKYQMYVAGLKAAREQIPAIKKLLASRV